MKNIFLITLVTLILNASAQKDTITQISTGFEFEMYNKYMNVHINNDTVVDADFYVNSNRLAWGNTPYDEAIETTKIIDSLVDLFSTTFEGIVTATGIISFSDSYGIYELNEVFVEYKDSSILRMDAFYDKQLKDPNGGTTEIFISYKIVLNQTQIDAFEVLLLSDGVKTLYLNWYNKILGNNN